MRTELRGGEPLVKTRRGFLLLPRDEGIERSLLRGGALQDEEHAIERKRRGRGPAIEFRARERVRIPSESDKRGIVDRLLDQSRASLRETRPGRQEREEGCGEEEREKAQDFGREKKHFCPRNRNRKRVPKMWRLLKGKAL